MSEQSKTIRTDRTEQYPVSRRNRVRRRHDRGHYDHGTIHALLDAGVMAHVAYVIEGQPFCTPTLYWREGTRLYWHGSSASRMLRKLSRGEPCCLTVTQMDSLVLARCGFNHSADYRSVMAFGRARLLDDPAEKARALIMMVDRFFPGRTATLRPSTALEIKATTVLWMDIEEASAKIRAKGVVDDDEDYAYPIHAERIPLRLVIGEPEPCPRTLSGVVRPESLAMYRNGVSLDEAASIAYKIAYPS
jgi:nitroimidazol reductase NimA-like FMN-containing flavoprotein (pyridoxamine 5'-phosphate oxidase superfamily)